MIREVSNPVIRTSNVQNGRVSNFYTSGKGGLSNCNSTLTRCKSNFVFKSPSIFKALFLTLFNAIWECLKSIPRTLDSFFAHVDFIPTNDVIGRREAKKLSEYGYLVFQAKSHLENLIKTHKENKAEIRKGWVSTYNSFPDVVRKKLLTIFFKDMARGCKIKDEKQVSEYVKDKLRSPECVNQAVLFYRDLKDSPGINSKKEESSLISVDPLHEDELPSALEKIGNEFLTESKRYKQPRKASCVNR